MDSIWMVGSRPRIVRMGASHTVYFAFKIAFGMFFAYSTNFVPDEFWQSTEVAYKWSFGVGHLTWEWLVGIRSYLVPSLIRAVYEVGKHIGLADSAVFLMMVPQFFQGYLTIIAIKRFFEFSVRRMGLKVGSLAYMLMMMNWFTSYCCARLITNQTEFSLNILCLWYLQRGNYASFTTFLTINFFIRPTAAVFWIPFIPEFLRKFKKRQILWSVGIAVVTIGYLVTVDCVMYGRFVVTPWEFFKFNFLSSGNEEFGVHPLLWYFYSGLPSILGPLVVILPLGFYIPGDTRRFSYYILFYLTVFSCIGHKEIRFLLPILPLVFIVASSVIWKICRYMERENILDSNEQRVSIGKRLLSAFTILNIIVAGYFGIFHQRGLRTVAARMKPDMDKMEVEIPEVWILTPCYSMPINTYFHAPNASIVHFICPPSEYEDLYDTESVHSNLLLQPETFETDETLDIITEKVKQRRAPDWIVAFIDHGPMMLGAVGRGDSLSSYFPKHNILHSCIGDVPRRIAVFQRHY